MNQRHMLCKAMQFSFLFWILTAVFSFHCFAVNTNQAFGETGAITIEKIECEGNKKTSCNYIIEQTTLKTKELVDEEKIKESKHRLELVGHFDDVDFRLAKGSEIGKATVIISVHEQSDFALFGELGFEPSYRDDYQGTSKKMWLNLTAADRNLTGTGDTLSFRYQDETDFRYYSEGNDKISNTSSMSIIRFEYNRPKLLLPNLFTTIGVSTNAPSSWGPPSFHWDIALGYKFLEFASLTAGYRSKPIYFRSISDNYQFDYPYDESTLTSFFSRLDWDSQDDPNFPTRGVRFQLAWDRLQYRVQCGWTLLDGVTPLSCSNSRMSLLPALVAHHPLSENNILSFRFGQFQTNDYEVISPDPAFAFRITHHLVRHHSNSSISNGSLYGEIGSYKDHLDLMPTFFDHTRSYLAWKPLPLNQIGVKAGVTFQTSFAVFNIFGMYVNNGQ